MERTYHVVGEGGIQIPLPLLESYGFHSGTHMVVEFGHDGLFIQPAKPTKTEISQRALRLLLRRLGDAVVVETEPAKADDPDVTTTGWIVTVYARGSETPLGTLRYSSQGDLICDVDSAIQQMWETGSKLSV
ncbi:MAG: hypothetical protein KF753_11735 [Caldilineaceae bacterium]|nr:hypothetical protein [Caldilineaceae bacterium]